MYIGNDLQIAHPSYKIIDDISSSFNGSTTSFALQVNGQAPVPFPISTQQVMISVNGVVQEPDPTGSAGFKLLGSNIVFSSAPANGHAFFGVINAGADYVTAGSEFPDGSVTAPSFTFQDDQDTGWYRISSGSVGYSANGVQILDFDGNGLNIPDDKKLIVGSGSDLQLYHSSGNSFITNATGTLKLRGSVIELSAPNAEVMLQGTADAALNLYHNGLLKLATSGTGATVTGTLVSDGLDVNGNSTFGSNGSITSGGNFTLNSNALTVTGTATVVGQFNGATIPTVQVSQTTDNTDIQIRANATGGLVRTASNKPLVFGTHQIERMRIDSSGKVGIGTTSPDYNLEIVGANPVLTIRDTETSQNSANARLRLAETGTGDVLDNYWDVAIDGQELKIIEGNLQTSTADTRLTIATDGAATFAGRLIGAKAGNSALSTPSLELYGSQSGATFGDLRFHNWGDSNGDYWQINSNLGLDSNGNTDKVDDSKKGAGITIDGRAGRIFLKTSHDGTSATNDVLIADSSGNATFGGTVSDSKGNLRSIPLNGQNGAYTLVAADAGKAVDQQNGGWTVNNSVFSAGDAVTLINNSGSDMTITQGSGLTIYNTADGTTGNRTLAGRGMATIYFVSASNCYISGAGLS